MFEKQWWGVVLEQTVVRRGSSVFCVERKSSEAERERLEPLERNERVCGGQSLTIALRTADISFMPLAEPLSKKY